MFNTYVVIPAFPMLRTSSDLIWPYVYCVTYTMLHILRLAFCNDFLPAFPVDDAAANPDNFVGQCGSAANVVGDGDHGHAARPVGFFYGLDHALQVVEVLADGRLVPEAMSFTTF